MKILVIGGGAREHAMASKLVREKDVEEVLCAPGNPGIAAVARCLPADVANPSELLAIASREQVDLTVVGPEVPLSLGVVDLFLSKHLAIVGPTKAAAALESSKSFAKDFMARHGVPTAKYVVCDSADAALAAIGKGEFGYPVVLKADGLAAGKGVVIAEDRATAEAAVREAMVDRRFGDAGNRVVIEEFLAGEEASYFVLADGTRVVSLSSAQDHKRIFDNDQGPNTGGMGAFSPSPVITPAMEQRVLDEIVRPVLTGMKAEGAPFRGFLYVGLMITPSGPKVIEFNVRFGDPEAQVVLPMLDEDLSWLLGAAATGVLPQRAAKFRDRPHVGVVIASAGYPESSDNGRRITGLDAAAAVPNAMVFHAGTAKRDGQIVSNGGRVLTVVGSGPTHREAIEVAYAAASHIRFDGMQYRRDIGQKALARS
ncbi:MAG TPA: phosphoribosylamine--glycine ligase [Vicinamibacterales bacterium]|jgi:phosphoribosylamine--glycine ligase|nr:phosphoribosylamine--glycine ligase [Vicinamibacterales bacterium]